MTRILLISLALAALPAHADAEYRQGLAWVRITARPCDNPQVLEQIKAAGDNPLDYRAARAEILGKPYAVCWKPLFERREVYLRFGDGDQGLIPVSEMKPVLEV